MPYGSIRDYEGAFPNVGSFETRPKCTCPEWDDENCPLTNGEECDKNCRWYEYETVRRSW